MEIKVMGLDPAFSNTGVCRGVLRSTEEGYRLDIVALDLIHTEAEKINKKVIRKNSDDLRRAQETSRQLREIINAWRPNCIFAEIPTGAQSARAAWALGIAVGVVGSIDRPIIQVLPREVKEAVGERHAGKDEIIDWAIGKYPDANWAWRNKNGEKIQVKSTNEHLADAVAAIHAGLLTDEFQRIASMLRVMR